MTGRAFREGLITEDSVCSALMSARGDLFLSASYLGVTARELDGYIRASENLQAFVASIERVKADPTYNQMSADQFSDELDRLTRAYRVEALDVIHELATMSFDSAAMAEVKLKAAVQLRGNQVEAQKGGDQLAVLAELNHAYQASAQRIKSIRVAQIEYEG